MDSGKSNTNFDTKQDHTKEMTFRIPSQHHTLTKIITILKKDPISN